MSDRPTTCSRHAPLRACVHAMQCMSVCNVCGVADAVHRSTVDSGGVAWACDRFRTLLRGRACRRASFVSVRRGRAKWRPCPSRGAASTYAGHCPCPLAMCAPACVNGHRAPRLDGSTSDDRHKGRHAAACHVGGPTACPAAAAAAPTGRTTPRTDATAHAARKTTTTGGWTSEGTESHAMRPQRAAGFARPRRHKTSSLSQQSHAAFTVHSHRESNPPRPFSPFCNSARIRRGGVPSCRTQGNGKASRIPSCRGGHWTRTQGCACAAPPTRRLPTTPDGHSYRRSSRSA